MNLYLNALKDESNTKEYVIEYNIAIRNHELALDEWKKCEFYYNRISIQGLDTITLLLAASDELLAENDCNTTLVLNEAACIQLVNATNISNISRNAFIKPIVEDYIKIKALSSIILSYIYKRI
jgi:hypothetical protein